MATTILVVESLFPLILLHSHIYPVCACVARGRVIVLSLGRSVCLLVCQFQVRSLSETGLYLLHESEIEKY